MQFKFYGKKWFTNAAICIAALVNKSAWFTNVAIWITAFVNQAFWFTSAAIEIAAFVNQALWFTSAAIQIVAFVNQINLKNATVFFTNAFERKTALNKEYSFHNFILVEDI